jgi:hypothetical protein
MTVFMFRTLFSAVCRLVFFIVFPILTISCNNTKVTSNQAQIDSAINATIAANNELMARALDSVAAAVGQLSPAQQIWQSIFNESSVKYFGTSPEYYLKSSDGSYMTGRDGSNITVPEIDWAFYINNDNSIKLTQTSKKDGTEVSYDGTFAIQKNFNEVQLICDFIENTNSAYPAKPRYILVVDINTKQGKCVSTSETGEPDFAISPMEIGTNADQSSDNSGSNSGARKECDDMKSYNMGYAAAEQQIGNGIATDCRQMWDNIHNDNDGLSYYCFCSGWSKYISDHL